MNPDGPSPAPHSHTARVSGLHLTDGELDDLLLGLGSARDQQHLAACASCTLRAESFAATLGSFNLASLAWSEAKSNTISRDLHSAPRAARPAYLRPGALWTAAASLLLAMTAGIGLHAHDRALEDAHTTAVAAELADDRDTQIANDNAMLREIDSALYTPVASPTARYGPAHAAVQE